MDPGARRELEILLTLAEERPVTQRALAQRLGIALGLANLYLKRLARKGYIKVTTIPPNRIKYLLTPQGLTEKTRLTYEYMRYSVRLYAEARQTLRDSLGPLARDGRKRIALYGTGEAAELAYLTLKELGLEPVLFLDGGGGKAFLGHPVRDLRDVSGDQYDCLVLATLDPPGKLVAELEACGVAPGRVVTLRPPAAGRSVS
ncbi:MAG TPA: winged helix-turn-helix transcriptional regulator [Methylomirabilota bacterium]|nr:winged helix-turn-helix transcriptional regulator [Methylomirabilota bacterium]